ncbi:transporter substrate-binding domain-containing protein [Sulfurimonas sp.]|uniref:transporter substrate-binding domain-containing protein n=1 Tax=Sulfurimonas sp. TaxID=2022749 RepID=UPI003564C336
MKSLLLHLSFFVLITTSLLSSELKFTQDELRWIKNNPVVKLGADYKWPPFDFVDSNGNHTGLSSEYIKLISKKSGLKFKIYPGVWSNVLNDMKAKKYDGLTCAVETDERKKYLSFSKNYLSVPMVIITLSNNNDIKTIGDLTKKSVSINRGSYIHEWLQSKYPDIKLHLTNSNEESMEAVSFGKADAYVGNLAVSTYIMNKYLLNNLKIVSKLKDFTTSVSVAINKENKVLFSIIQKSIKSITPQEHQKLKSKWKKNFNFDQKDSQLNFSKKQRDWIKKHSVVKYTGDPDWLPFEAVSKNKQHIGIAAEYVKEIEEQTGIEFKYIPYPTWSDAISNIKNSNVSMIVETTDSKLDLEYTKPFIANSIVIVMNKDTRYIEDLNIIANKKIALIKDYGYVPKLKQEYKDIDFFEVNNIKEGLSAVSTGKYDALLCTSALSSYEISEMGLHNIAIVGKTTISTEVGFGVRKEYKPLVGIINIVLQNIDKKKKHDILMKWTYQKYVEKIDYTLVWQIAAIFVFFISGTLYWNRKLSVEIHKRKLAQEELFQLNKKLKEAKDIAVNANKAKTDFLSNMSHEIRTPMNAILGFAELLDKKVEDKKLKSFVKTIRSSGQTLLFLINDILDLSKIESGKLELTKSRVSLQNLCEDTINIFSLQAEQKGLKLTLEIDNEMPKAILVDKMRLNEILINLIGNAIKFTQNGYVKVVVVINDVYDHSSKVDLTIRVEDSGIGIDKSEHNKIFNIFEQSQNQDVKKYGGTGLGLAISKKLSILMGGSLNVESELGKGAAFIVSLKNIDIASLNDDECFSKSSIDYSSIEFESAVILVVDDVNENRGLVKESFVGTNIKILEATNGKVAIDIIKAEHIDLVLMDIRMPVMDGYTATRLVKEFSRIPIIALTASIMEDELKKLEGERFDGYLRKPISKSELFKEISKFLSFKEAALIPKKQDEIIIDNLEDLKNFLDAVEGKLKESYLQANKTNDINAIENFVKALLELSSQYNIKYMLEYSKEFIEKIDSFEIEAINRMLDEYEIKMKDLKSKL